jgi:peroxiredoxin
MINMINHKMITFSLLMIWAVSGFAQVAEQAEDIAPLLIGEQIPAAEITTLDGESVVLTDLLSGKKSILLFYRGGWCPYCNAHLSAVGKVERELIELGYEIIAFSPDSPEELTNTIEKGALSYALYSDASGALMKSMGIAFQAPERYGPRLDKFSGGLNRGLLPVPSIFVVDEEGMIQFEYISPNYKQRMTTELLLAVLENLPKNE